MIFNGVTRNQVAGLACESASPAISVYVPTSRRGHEVLQGRIRLKNLLTQAEERLVEGGMRHTLALDLLAEARRLDEDASFWNERADGLALFIAPGGTEGYHLPFAVSETLHVGERFYVRPLMRVLSEVVEYFVLVLDRHGVRLVRCGPSAASEVDVPEMPRTIEALVGVEYSEKQLQLHTAGPAGHAGSVIGHGSGDKGADEKDRSRRFCVAVSRAVEAHLAGTEAPVLLAGTEELQDTFRLVSRLPRLLDRGIVGSSKLLNLNDLRAHGQPIVDADADTGRQVAIDRYRAMAGTGLTSQQIEEILPAAEGGRIEALFAYDDTMVWGNREDGRLHLHADRALKDEEIVNEAAIATVIDRGAYYAVAPDELELSGGVAATFRY